VVVVVAGGRVVVVVVVVGGCVVVVVESGTVEEVSAAESDVQALARTSSKTITADRPISRRIRIPTTPAAPHESGH
jgi:hypothetical protein